jgi:hypothetical protein
LAKIKDKQPERQFTLTLAALTAQFPLMSLSFDAPSEPQQPGASPRLPTCSFSAICFTISMRIGLVCGALLLLAGCVTGQGQSENNGKADTLARWHFIGTKQLANAKDLPAWREILALKESADLRKVAVEGFAMQVAGHFTKTNATNINAQIAALIKPLLPDVIENESRFDLWAHGAQDADWSLSVKLPAERTAEWTRNLSNLAVAAHMTVVAGEKNGISAQRENYRFSFSPGSDWTLLQGGFGTTSAKSRKMPKAGKEVLSAELNCPAIAKLWSAERFQHSPKLTLNVLPQKGGLHSEMVIDYPQPLNIKSESWNAPTDLIRDPLIGFTAIQGIARALEDNAQFKNLGAEKTPNQAFLWSQSTFVFTVFAAADVGNPGTVVSNIVAKIVPNMMNLGGNFIVSTNRPAVTWQGPYITPFVEAANDGKSPFLVGGLFPVKQDRAKPAPPELFAQLKKRNLVYYDWEITGERLKQWRPIWQAAQFLHGKDDPYPSASDPWIEAISPHLENTVTEGTLEGPSRIKLVRQSQSGLSALELVLLAHALDPYDLHERHTLPPGQQPARRSKAPVPRAFPIQPAPPKR